MGNPILKLSQYLIYLAIKENEYNGLDCQDHIPGVK